MRLILEFKTLLAAGEVVRPWFGVEVEELRM